MNNAQQADQNLFNTDNGTHECITLILEPERAFMNQADQS